MFHPFGRKGGHARSRLSLAVAALVVLSPGMRADDNDPIDFKGPTYVQPSPQAPPPPPTQPSAVQRVYSYWADKISTFWHNHIGSAEDRAASQLYDGARYNDLNPQQQAAAQDRAIDIKCAEAVAQLNAINGTTPNGNADTGTGGTDTGTVSTDTSTSPAPSPSPDASTGTQPQDGGSPAASPSPSSDPNSTSSSDSIPSSSTDADASS